MRLLVMLVANLLLCSSPSPSPGTQSLSEEVTVNKDLSDPTSAVVVGLPSASVFNEYLVNVVDISSSIEGRDRDANRSEVGSKGVLHLAGLHAGHEYSVSVVGRHGNNQQLVKQEKVLMQPIPPDLNSSHTHVLLSTSNLTIRTMKPLHAIQDAFRVHYQQMDPVKEYATLDVHDIAEQRHLDIYLGKLNPGHSYNVTITALMHHLESKPWQGLFITKPLPPHNVSVVHINSTCVHLMWNMSVVSGYDRFLITYAPLHSLHKTQVNSSQKRVLLCNALQYGMQYQFSVFSVKGGVHSEVSSIVSTVKPKPALSMNVTVDMEKAMFRIEVVVPEPEDSKVQQCALTIHSEGLLPIHKNAKPQGNKPRSCWIAVQLHPGTRYELWTVTRSEGAVSSKLTSSFALQPAFDMKAFGLDVVEKQGALLVEWPSDVETRQRLVHLWDSVVGRESALHVRIDPVFGGSNLKQQARQLEGNPHDNTPLVVRGLQDGACYKIRMYTVTYSGIVSTQRMEHYYRMNAPSMTLNVDEVAMRSVTIRLSSNSSVYDCIVHVVLLEGMHIVHDRRISSYDSILLDTLTPYHKYSLTAQVRCGNRMELCPISTHTLSAQLIETRQDKPGPVHNISVHAINPFSAQLMWCAPTLPNGAITHYIVHVEPMDNRQHSWSVSVTARPNTTLTAVIDNLIGDKLYQIGVRAVTQAGPGDVYAASDAVTVHMPLLAPPTPNGLVHVTNNIDTHSVQVTYSTSLFNNKHGVIIRSLVIVAQTGHEMDESNSTLTWSQVHDRAVWPPYAAIETVFTEPLPLKTISVTIGTDETCTHKQHVCNGPLKSNVAYRFKLRLFTSPVLFTDSDYSEVVVTEGTSNALSNAMVLVVCLMLLGAGGSMLLLLNRRPRPTKACASNPTTQSQWSQLKMMMAERAANCLAKLGLDSPPPCNDALTAPFGHHRRSRSLRERTGVDQRLERLPSGSCVHHKSTLFTVLSGCNADKSRPVRVNDLIEHVRLMSADSDFLFSDEYEDLKTVGNGQACIAADLTVNRAKNRFTNVLPYDHSRVKLLPVDDDEGSDYVNASYIPGFNSPREFIAAQGPLPSTRDHLWRVVWEQQCPVVVALTKCVEKGRDKCHQYWPDQHQLSVLYAHIEVTLMHETVHDEFTIRELSLMNVAEPNAPPRILHHLHYMAWPDFGVPDQPTGIVEFVRVFRSKLPPAACNKPSIVHCSAGVGRSGTFIALDRLLQCVYIERPLDVFGIVYEMRLQRCHMVQNEQQYIFIHHCLKHVIDTLNNTQPAVDTPSIQVHHNAAFDEDEGIAEASL